MVLERFEDHSQLLAEEEEVLVILPTNRQTHKIFTVFISFSFISIFFYISTFIWGHVLILQLMGILYIVLLFSFH